MNSNLGPQFYSHEQLGALQASDYKGTVAEGVGAMKSWQEKFGGPKGYGNAREYDEGDGPEQAVERLRPSIRERGVEKPITVVDWGDYESIKDGHHRAVAAHLEGKGAPVERMTVDQYTRRRYG